MRFARTEGVYSHAAAQLVLSARLLVRMRGAAAAEDWGLVHRLSSALRTEGLGSAVCLAEGIPIPMEASVTTKAATETESGAEAGTAAG